MTLRPPDAADDKPIDGGLRVAITHDFMDVYGGAERVTQAMALAFPDATVTAIVGRDSVAQRMGVSDRFHSVLPARPAMLRHYREVSPLLWGYLRAYKLPEADVVLSSSYAFAHLLGTANAAPRVCYCHSPLRFAWSMTGAYRAKRTNGPVTERAFNSFAAVMRGLDRRAADDVDLYLTQSDYVGDQIERFYGHTPTVIGAPVDCELFRPDHRPPDDHYLMCGRLSEPYKRMDLVVKAFARFPDERLVIAGDGPAMADLRALAGDNVEFVGELGDADLARAMQRCKAAIFPSQDDFGLVPVEVMACGRPVLAFCGGGARHTIIPGTTGALFDEQSDDSFVAAFDAFEPSDYDTGDIREHALGWDSVRFRSRLVEAVRLTAAGHGR